MNFKRGIFIGALMVLFLCCYHIMNQHYDELSRYQYANDENRKLILEHMTTDDINYLIDRQYKPEQFLRYLGLEGFDIRNVDWYNYAKSVENLSDEEIIGIVATLKERMSYSDFKVYGENYSISQLRDFYMGENSYVNELSLIRDPNLIKTEIVETESLFTYVPNNLVEFEDAPIVNQIEGTESITIQEKVVEPLNAMCKAAFEVNEKTCGNMVIVQGYVSFEKQEKLYQEALLTYGIDDVLNHVSYPGQSIFQLGNVIKIVPASIEVETLSEEDKPQSSIQQLWLIDHAKEYGFEFVNDPTQPLSEFILQYNGVEITSEVDEKGEDSE